MVNVRWKMAFSHLRDAQLDVRLGALRSAGAWQNRATEVVATGTEVVGDPECGLMSRGVAKYFGWCRPVELQLNWLGLPDRH